MIWDDLSIFIVREIMRKKETTTRKIARAFKWDDKPFFPMQRLETRFYCKKESLILLRLKTMSKEGLIEIKKEENKNSYEILSDRVRLKKFDFPDGKKDALCVKESKNKWSAFEI